MKIRCQKTEHFAKGAFSDWNTMDLKLELKAGTGKTLALGFFGGITVGVLARVWMRWISTDPEFSWSGSIFIVMSFTIFFTTQSIVAVFRRRVRSRRATTLVRIFGVIFSLPLFSAAGAVMLPTVAIASIVLWTEGLKRLGRKGRIARAVLLVLSLAIPVNISKDIISDFGWTIPTLGRILLFATIYGLVIIATRPTLKPYFDENSGPRKLSQLQKVLLMIGALGIVLFLFVSIIGIGPGI